MPDERQRILMEVVNADKIRDLTKDLDKEIASLDSLAKQLRETSITQGMFNAAAAGHAKKAAELRGEIRTLEQQTKTYGQAALTAAHATQDFVQGGVGGVLNNIPMLVQQLGGPAGLTAIISGVGIAAYVATPYLKAWWKSLAGGEAIGGLAGLSKALDGIKAEIDKIKEADAWNLETIQRYNEKLVDQAQIEKEIADRKKHKTDYEAFMATQTNEDEQESEGLRKAFKEVFGGLGKELQADLMRSLEAEAQAERIKLREQRKDAERRARNPNIAAAERNEARNRVGQIDSQIAAVGNNINNRVINIVAEAAGGSGLQKQKAALEEIRNRTAQDEIRRKTHDVEEAAGFARFGLDVKDVKKKDLEDAKEAAQAKTNRAARRAAQAEEDRQNATDSAEEKEVLGAMNFIGRNYPKLQATEAERVGIAESALGNLRADPSVTHAQAAALAVNQFRDRGKKVSDAAQLDQFRGQIDAGTGGAMNQDQLAEAAKRTQDLVKQGFNAQWAMAAAVRQMQMDNQELAGQVAALNGFVGQLQQGQQVTRGRLQRNRR